jgi:hypothetical protein
MGYRPGLQIQLRDTWLGRAFKACFWRRNWAFGAVALGVVIDGCVRPGNRLSYLWVWGPMLLVCWGLGVVANRLWEVP